MATLQANLWDSEHAVVLRIHSNQNDNLQKAFASQEARDFDVSLFSAIANYLVLRLTEADAKVLARNVASSDQERMLIDRIKQMDRFKAFYCCEGVKKPVPVKLLE